MKKIDFNRDWDFFKYNNETEIQKVNLPHDAMLYENRDPDCLNGNTTGFYPGGKYVYRKNFWIAEGDLGKKFILEFEGVYQRAYIMVNGKQAAYHPYGYTGFYVELSENLAYGSENEVKVIVDNSKEPNTRWYSGSGMYRPVYLHIADSDKYIAVDGIQVKTISYDPAIIHVHTVTKGGSVKVEIRYKGEIVSNAVGNDVDINIPNANLWSDKSPELYECRVTLYDNEKICDEQMISFGIRLIEWGAKGLFINGNETKLRGACIHHDNGILGACEYVAAAHRRIRILKESGFNAIRSAHNPCSKAILYACDKAGIYVMDELSDMWYDHKNKYDYVNEFEEWHEKDLAAMVQKNYSHPSVIMYSIGNEVTETGKPRGIELTKEMTELMHKLDDSRPVTCGINMSLNVMHFAGMGVYKDDSEPAREPEPKNPKAVAILKEQMKGMKAQGGQPAEEGNASAATMGQSRLNKKDGKLVGSEYFNKMMVEMKEQQSKVVTQEIAKVLSEEAYAYLDIAGYNYATGRYYLDQEEYPSRVSVGSETLPQKIAVNWKMVTQLPYIIGDFMWTGWDYLGEAGIGAFCYDTAGVKDKEYPALLAGCGIIDICGQKRPEVWLGKAAFGLSDVPYIGVEPVTHSGENHIISAWRFSDAVRSWSWEGCEGRPANIIVYSNAVEVELLLNGTVLERKAVENCQVKFTVEYQPGILQTIAYNHNGEKTGKDRLITAGEETRIELVPEATALKADGQDLCYVHVLISDRQGNVKASIDHEITVEVEGAGTLAGFGNADPFGEEPYVTKQNSTYYGKALAVIRAGYQPGSVTLSASAEGMEEQKITVKVG